MKRTLISTREAAEQLCEDYETLRKRIQRRKLQPTSTVGHVHLWTQKQVEQMR